MEIVHVVRQYNPSVGGLEDTVANLCRHLARTPGVRVRVVTLNRLFTAPGIILPDAEIIDGIEVTRINYMGSSRYPVAPHILKAIQSAHIVHVHAIDWFFDFLAWTRWLHRKKLVASTHGGFFHTAYAATLKKLFFETVTRASCLAYARICASSENDAATFRRISGRVVTIENGVNIEKWHGSGSESAQRRMIFIGRWSANKCIGTLFALLAQLKKCHNDWELIIAGVPSDETLQSLTQLAGYQEVASAVNFQVNPDEAALRTLIGACSYIVSASNYEGFGLSIVEGLSAGLFPIVSPIPPFERLLEKLGFGERILPDLYASAVAIERNHQTLEKQSHYYRKRAMDLADSYGWNGVAAAFLHIYEELMPPV